MTNNLKAERTLTAEELQTIIDGCEKLAHGPWFHGPAEGRNGTAGLAQVDNGAEMWPVIAEWPEAEHISRLDPETVKAMASMALQSLSTQQPMGEVTELIAWLRARSEPDSGIRYGENSSGIAEATLFGYDAAYAAENFHGNGAARLADALTAALHPNQEGGE